MKRHLLHTLLLVSAFAITVILTGLFRVPPTPLHYVDATLVSFGPTKEAAEARGLAMAEDIGDYSILSRDTQKQVSTEGPYSVIYYVTRTKIRVDTDALRARGPKVPQPKPSQTL